MHVHVVARAMRRRELELRLALAASDRARHFGVRARVDVKQRHVRPQIVFEKPGRRAVRTRQLAVLRPIAYQLHRFEHVVRIERDHVSAGRRRAELQPLRRQRRSLLRIHNHKHRVLPCARGGADGMREVSVLIRVEDHDIERVAVERFPHVRRRLARRDLAIAQRLQHRRQLLRVHHRAPDEQHRRGAHRRVRARRRALRRLSPPAQRLHFMQHPHTLLLLKLFLFPPRSPPRSFINHCALLQP
mmetsp:Transcript_2546/g.6918  ORF Transcript_2546/g.6918 Transcript_2546/m.6918 type:complete len:245 (-) Transcript_2546:17-751(-)